MLVLAEAGGASEAAETGHGIEPGNPGAAEISWKSWLLEHPESNPAVTPAGNSSLLLQGAGGLGEEQLDSGG